MDFWSEVDAREEQRKQAARAYRESLKQQQEQLKAMKKQRESYWDSRSNIDESPVANERMEMSNKISLPQISPTPYQTAAYNEPSLASPIRMSTDQLAVSTVDNSEVRLLKEQLMNERQRASQIESELRKQQSMIISIQNQMEQQRFALSEMNNIRLLNQKYETQLASMAEQQFQHRSKTESLEQRIQQISNEISTRESFAEQARTDVGDKMKIMLDEVANIKYKYEQMSLESVQADQELFHRTRELESHAVNDSSVKQLVRNHDVKISALEHDLSTAKEVAESSVSKLRGEMRQLIEFAEKNRQHFETNVMKQNTDIKNIVELNSRETATKLASLKEKIVNGFENELSAVNSQMRELSIQLRRVEADANSRLNSQVSSANSQLSSVQAALKEEISTRKQVEVAIRADTDVRLKQIEMDLQNIKDLSEAFSSNGKNEISNTFQKVVEQMESFEFITNDRLRVIEERTSNENKRASDANDSVRKWAEGYIEKITTDLSRTLEAKILALEHSSQIVSKKLENSDFEKAIKLLREQDFQSLVKIIDALKARISSAEAIVSTRLDEYMQRENEIRSKMDDLSVQSTSSSQLSKISELVGKTVTNLDRLAERLSSLETKVIDATAKAENIMKDSHKLSRELELRPTLNQIKDEYTHLESLIKNTENGLRKTWKAIESVRGDSDRQSNISLVTDILSELQLNSEKVTSLDREMKLFGSNVQEITGIVMDEIKPKIGDVEKEVSNLRLRIKEDIERKLVDLEASLNLETTNSLKEQQNIRDKLKNDVEKLTKIYNSKFVDTESAIENLQQTIVKTESALRKNQERYGQSYNLALDSQFQTITKWKEKFHDEITELKQSLEKKIVFIGSQKGKEPEDINTDDILDEYDDDDLDDDDDLYAEKISKVLQDADRVLAKHEMDFPVEPETMKGLSPEPHLNLENNKDINSSLQKLTLEEKKEETKRSILKNLNESRASNLNLASPTKTVQFAQRKSLIPSKSVNDLRKLGANDEKPVPKRILSESHLNEIHEINFKDKQGSDIKDKGQSSSIKRINDSKHASTTSEIGKNGSKSYMHKSASRNVSTSRSMQNIKSRPVLDESVKKSTASLKQPLFGPS